MSTRSCACESVYVAWRLSQNGSSAHSLSTLSAIFLFAVPFSTHSTLSRPSLLPFLPSLSGFFSCLFGAARFPHHPTHPSQLTPSPILSPDTSWPPIQGNHGQVGRVVCLPSSGPWLCSLCILVHTALYTAFPY